MYDAGSVYKHDASQRSLDNKEGAPGWGAAEGVCCLLPPSPRLVAGHDPFARRARGAQNARKTGPSAAAPVSRVTGIIGIIGGLVS